MELMLSVMLGALVLGTEPGIGLGPPEWKYPHDHPLEIEVLWFDGKLEKAAGATVRLCPIGLLTADEIFSDSEPRPEGCRTTLTDANGRARIFWPEVNGEEQFVLTVSLWGFTPQAMTLQPQGFMATPTNPTVLLVPRCTHCLDLEALDQ